MAFDITATKILQVQLGVTAATFNGNEIPIPDGDNDVVMAFTETKVPFRGMGNKSILGNFRSRQDLETVTLPFIQTGEALFNLLFGGLSGGGGAPNIDPTAVLIITGRVGTLTAWAASPNQTVAFNWGDTAVTSVAAPFSCVADSTRAAGEQGWTFTPA